MADSAQTITGNTEFYEGTDRDLVFTHSGNDATTASAIKFVLSADPASTALITKTLGNGVTADSATQITVSLDQSDTADLGGQTYYWELRMTASSKQDVIASGTVDIIKGNSD